MFSLLTSLLGWFGGSTVDRVLSHLEQKADEQTKREKLRTQVTIETIKAEVASRQAAKAIVLAEQGWWVTAMIRPAFAWPLILWWAAVIADSIFSFGWEIAALPAPLDEWSGWIIAAYFVTRPMEKVARGALNRSRSS